MSKEKLQWFEESLLEVRKVTKVTTGWRRMRFRATVLVGDKGWNIGIWVGKGTDVAIAVSKATHDAYKNVTQVSITKSGSVPYQVNCKYKSCLVTLRPAGSGTGLKAWSSVRIVLELAGYTNILSKVIGSSNSLNNAIAVVSALTSFKVNQDHIQVTKTLVKEAGESKESKKTDKPKKSDTMKKHTSTTPKSDTSKTEETPKKTPKPKSTPVKKSIPASKKKAE